MKNLTMFKEWLSKLMGSVLQLMCITCRDVSPVIAEMVDHPVSPGKYWRAKIHLAMCGVCRYYKTQLKILTRLTHELANINSPVKIDFTLSPESQIPVKKILNPRTKEG